MLTGRPLFPEGRTAQKLVWQQIKEPVPVDRLRPEVPPDLALVVHRMLQKKPVDRFQTPQEVFEALAHYVSDQVPPPDPTWLPEPAARVVLARTAVPGASTPRQSGSTSKILAAAMRTGSGSTSASAIQRKGEKKNPDTASDTNKLTITPSGQTKERSTSATNTMALDETQRTPGPSPAPRSPGSSNSVPPFNPTIVICALALALLLALLGIIILLLRG
jgi:hypothetical protein